MKKKLLYKCGNCGTRLSNIKGIKFTNEEGYVCEKCFKLGKKQGWYKG